MNELCIVMIIDRMYYDLFRSKSSPLKKASHDAEIDWARRSVLLTTERERIPTQIPHLS